MIWNYLCSVKKLILFLFVLFIHGASFAQCAMCTKTAAGLDDDSAQGLNNGIIFLALTPLFIIFILGFVWYRRNKHEFVA
jgi:hypothetical protein